MRKEKDKKQRIHRVKEVQNGRDAEEQARGERLRATRASKEVYVVVLRGHRVARTLRRLSVIGDGN